MKGLVLRGGKVELRADLSVPQPGPGEALERAVR